MMQNKVANNHAEGVARQGLILAELSLTRAVSLSEDRLYQELVPDEVGRPTVAVAGVESGVKACPGRTGDDQRSIEGSWPRQLWQRLAADPRRSG